MTDYTINENETDNITEKKENENLEIYLQKWNS